MDPLKQFLEDSQKYPDNTPIRIGEVEVPLGSLRALNTSERTALADRLKNVETTEKDLATQRANVGKLAKDAQQLVSDYQAKIAALPNPKPEAGNDPWADPWLAPVKGALDARDKKIEELSASLKTAATTIANAATIWAEDRWDREYGSIDFGKREKKPTREELIKFATDNNLVDRHKMPSVTKAWEQMSSGDRLAEQLKAAEDRGRELGRQELIASRVPPPGTSGPGQGAMPSARMKPGEGDLGDIYAEALKDPELKALLEATSAAGIM
jgi:hypothetical protein